MFLDKRKRALNESPSLAAAAPPDGLLTPLPEGAAPVAGGLAWPRDPFRSRGRLLLVLVGTYGVREGLRIIRHFVNAGREEDIGVCIVIELSEAPREQFLAALAKVSPALYRRTVACTSTLVPGGLQGADVEHVGSEEYRQYWQPVVEDTLEDACRLVRGTEMTVIDPASPGVQLGYDPAAILNVASTGGHLLVGSFVADYLHREFPLVPSYVVTNLPDDPDLRAEFPSGLRRYQQGNFVRWFFVSDDLLRPVENDYMTATLFSGIWVAPHLSDLLDDPWNTLGKFRSRAVHTVLAASFWGRNLPVQHTTDVPARYYTFHDACIRACLDGVTGVGEATSRAIALTPADDGSRQVTLFTLPLVPASLVRVKDAVEQALVARGFYRTPNQKTLWATTSEPLSTTTRDLPMSVIRVAVAAGGVDELGRLARPQAHTQSYVVPVAPPPNGRVYTPQTLHARVARPGRQIRRRKSA